MVHLASGYVMKPEVVTKFAHELGLEPTDTDASHARTYINRYLRKLHPEGPSVHMIDYAPLKPDYKVAFIFPTKYDDDRRGRKFEERPIDLKIKQDFMELGGLEENDIWWDTVYRYW